MSFYSNTNFIFDTSAVCGILGGLSGSLFDSGRTGGGASWNGGAAGAD